MTVDRDRHRATVYALGRSGCEASTYCKDLDALAAFLPRLGPGDYWIKRCIAPAAPDGYREPLEEVDWGVVRVDSDGCFTLCSLVLPRDDETDVRSAWADATIPEPERDG